MSRVLSCGKRYPLVNGLPVMVSWPEPPTYHHNARPPRKRRRGKHARTHDRWSVHTMMTMNGIYNPHLVRHILHPETDGA
jgi:hypothetical protein